MKSTLKVVTVIIFILLFISCNVLENVTTSATKILLISLTGKDAQGKAGSSIIFSDVVDDTKGILNDNATAEIQAVCINPTACGEESSYYQTAIIDQIDVKFTRINSNNEEGVDVPYSFSQQIHETISIGGQVGISFVIISHTAKMHHPLISLRELGQGKILQLMAKVTIHGKDVAGNRLEPAVGYVTIYCANFGDPVEEKEEPGR